MKPVQSSFIESCEQLESVLSDPIDRFVLANGLTVIHKNEPGSGLVSSQIWVKTGSIHEGDLTGCGLSHYLEHMLFKGTERRKTGEISREVQAAGGSINAYTSFARTVYHIDAPAESFKMSLDILDDMIFHSTLSAEDVEKERDVILREIDMGLDDPDRLLSRAMFSNAYRVHPYNAPVIGHRDLFLKVTRDDLWSYYKGRYVTTNMVLVIVGDVSLEQLKEALADNFEKEERSLLLKRDIQKEPPQYGFREERLHGDLNICRGAMAFKMPALHHEDAAGLDMLASVLGGGESSILYRVLRDDLRLVHYIDASTWNPGSSGLFWISYICDSGRSAEVEAAVLEEIESLCENGVDQADLDKALRMALVSEVNSRKSVSGQASRLGVYETTVHDLDYAKHYFDRLSLLTADSLGQLAGAYLKQNKLTAVVLDSEEQSQVANPLKPRELCRDFETVSLPNGSKIVYQVDKRLPKVHVRYLGYGGPCYEASDKRGITGLMTTLLTRDTRYNSSQQVARKIESRGGSFGDSAGNNTFGLYLEVLSADLELGLSLLEEALLFPSFSEDTLLIEKEGQLSQLQEFDDEIVEKGRRCVRKLFYGDHPLAIDAFGDEAQLEGFTMSDVIAQFKKLVVAENSVISICGQFDPDLIIPRLEIILEQLGQYSFFSKREAFDGLTNVGEFSEYMDRNQTVVFQSYQGPGVTSPDYLAAELLEDILSDMAGELFTKVREEQSMAYFVGASRMNAIDEGMFTFYAGTHPDMAPKVLLEFDCEVARISGSGLTEAEIERSRKHLVTRKLASMQAIGSRAMQAGLNVLYGQPVNDWDNYAERLAAIGVQELAVFGQKYLRDDKRIKFSIGPNGKKDL